MELIYIAIGAGLCGSFFVLLLMIALCRVASASDARIDDEGNEPG